MEKQGCATSVAITKEVQMSQQEQRNPHFTKEKLVVVIEAVLPIKWEDMTHKQRKQYLNQLQRKHYSFLRVLDR